MQAVHQPWHGQRMESLSRTPGLEKADMADQSAIAGIRGGVGWVSPVERRVTDRRSPIRSQPH